MSFLRSKPERSSRHPNERNLLKLAIPVVILAVILAAAIPEEDLLKESSLVQSIIQLISQLPLGRGLVKVSHYPYATSIFMLYGIVIFTVSIVWFVAKIRMDESAATKVLGHKHSKLKRLLVGIFCSMLFLWGIFSDFDHSVTTKISYSLMRQFIYENKMVMGLFLPVMAMCGALFMIITVKSAIDLFKPNSLR